MDATFSLIFTPLEQDNDYGCEIHAHTEREAFILPVKAFGVRAVLDFPDRVVWDDAPVRYSSTKTLLVRNIGKRAAKFTLNVEAPFYPSPPSGYIEVGGMMQVDMDFRPMV
jgi:hydrocephalus-inducing protein